MQGGVSLLWAGLNGLMGPAQKTYSFDPDLSLDSEQALLLFERRDSDDLEESMNRPGPKFNIRE
jgi:hypothetical protein